MPQHLALRKEGQLKAMCYHRLLLLLQFSVLLLVFAQQLQWRQLQQQQLLLCLGAWLQRLDGLVQWP